MIAEHEEPNIKIIIIIITIIMSSLLHILYQRENDVVSVLGRAVLMILIDHHLMK